MPTGSASASCVVCGWRLSPAEQACPECHASADWQDLLTAAQFAQDRFQDWEQGRSISKVQFWAIMEADNQLRQALKLMAREGQPLPKGTGLPLRTRCWQCDAELCGSPSHCSDCGVPVEGGSVQQLRYWTYTRTMIRSHYDARRLPLSQAHARINDANGHIAVLRANLEKERQPVVAHLVDKGATGQPADSGAAVADPLGTEHTAAPTAPPLRSIGAKAAPRVAVEPPQPRTPQRPFWEILLDPRSIQWLLGLGGALLVLGLVIWLATMGIFQHAAVVAVALGLGNAAILGGGWIITVRTRYQTAGRALTLLACLVMPLNLYFYHAYDLITLEGHLWVAALACSLLYAASAWVLRDRLFVYVLAGGVAMTGLLILADMGKFWEIAAPATLLVALGLICIHAERAFAGGESPFSRQRFGLAFFWSGHALLAAGLLLLLGAQIAGDWLYEPFFRQFYQKLNHGPPAVVAEHGGRILALILVVVATYAYTYSDLMVRRVGAYIYLAVFTLLWTEVLVIQLLPVPMTTEVAIIALALTALAANLFAPSARRWQQSLVPGEGANSLALAIRPLQRAGVPLGLVLSTLPVLLGIMLHLRATYVGWPLPDGQPYTVGWPYVCAMLITAVACRIGAHLYRHTIAWLSTAYIFGTAAATLVGAAGILSVLGMKSWDNLGPLLMVIPILYAIAARLYRGRALENPLTWAAHTATAVMFVAVLAASAGLTPQHISEPTVGQGLNLPLAFSLALVSAEATVFYLLMALFRKQGVNVYLGTATACCAVWQLLRYWEVAPEYYTLTFALAGLALLIGYRLAIWERARLAQPAFDCANALMSLSFVAAALLTLSRMATGLAALPTQRPPLDWSLVILLGALGLLSLLAVWLVRHPGWRRWYVVTAITEAALMFLAIHVLSHLSIWEKLEIFAVAAGVGLLIAGHVGWYREQEKQDDMVTFSLGSGALLVAMPLAIAVVLHRSVPHFSALNELGMLAAGVLLLATGFMFQIRSTTLAGVGLLLIYLSTLVLYVNMLENVQTAAIWMAIGGAVLFGTGILLSIYRDRLLTLPDRVKRREGVFRVIGWR
jgi:hypothetical protein